MTINITLNNETIQSLVPPFLLIDPVWRITSCIFNSVTFCLSEPRECRFSEFRVNHSLWAPGWCNLRGGTLYLTSTAKPTANAFTKSSAFCSDPMSLVALHVCRRKRTISEFNLACMTILLAIRRITPHCLESRPTGHCYRPSPITNIEDTMQITA